MADVRTRDRLTLAERRQLRASPELQRQLAAEACTEAAELCAAGSFDEAEQVLMHAYHSGAPAVVLWLVGIEQATGAQP